MFLTRGLDLGLGQGRHGRYPAVHAAPLPRGRPAPRRLDRQRRTVLQHPVHCNGGYPRHSHAHHPTGAAAEQRPRGDSRLPFLSRRMCFNCITLPSNTFVRSTAKGISSWMLPCTGIASAYLRQQWHTTSGTSWDSICLLKPFGACCSQPRAAGATLLSARLLPPCR